MRRFPTLRVDARRFTLEIRDDDADKITSIAKAIDYVASQPDGSCAADLVANESSPVME